MRAKIITSPLKKNSQLEESVKADFAQVFTESNWCLFKRVADFHFERAARLRIADMKLIEPKWRLLARNAEKRLRIGIGTELLLKAVYLKHGFVINTPKQKSVGAPHFPFTWLQAQGIDLDSGRTYMLGTLISGLGKVPVIGKLGPLSRGLQIAQVFRNKEGHSVSPKHNFNPQNYREIEKSLVEIYFRAFDQILRVQFSLTPHEKPLWRIRQ